jgi:hypothetical protein
LASKTCERHNGFCGRQQPNQCRLLSLLVKGCWS